MKTFVQPESKEGNFMCGLAVGTKAWVSASTLVTCHSQQLGSVGLSMSC